MIKKPEDSISKKHIELVNLIYELMYSPSLFSDFASQLSKLMPLEENMSILEKAFKNSAKIATQTRSLPKAELTRDLGLLIVGINSSNIVSTVPPSSTEWLGAKFVGNPKGIGWIRQENQNQNIAHILKTNNLTYLPIHSNLQSALTNGTIANLLLVHQFNLSNSAQNALKQIYGLTPAEIRLCKDMAESKTLKQSAHINNIKISTVQSQLKNIFQKIGINSQLALVKLLTQISAASAIHDFRISQNIEKDPDWKNDLISIQTNDLQTRYGTRLSYSKFGCSEGKPVLFFHHGVGSRLHTREMAEHAKKQNLLIYKFDRPGFGHTEILPTMNTKKLSYVVTDLIKAVSPNNHVSLIGYGVGGKVILDILPEIQAYVDKVALYSYRGEIRSSKTTVMHKITQLVWQYPNIAKNFLQILTSNSSTKTMKKNLASYYQDSEVDKIIISNPKFCNERIEEVKMSMRQKSAGTIFEYGNLKKSLPVLSNLNSQISFRAIFGDKDEFNSIEDAKKGLKKLSNCHVLHSKGHGQLHLYHDFETFLKSAFSELKNCPWLTEVTSSQL